MKCLNESGILRKAKSVFLSDSDEEATVEFVKQNEELYDNTNNSFKDK